jgi:hypothetical protein
VHKQVPLPRGVHAYILYLYLFGFGYGRIVGNCFLREARFTIKGTQFLGFPYMAANFSIFDSESAPTEIPRRSNKKFREKKKVIKTTPKKGHGHCLLCWPADVKKQKSGLSRRKLVVLGWQMPTAGFVLGPHPHA